MRRKILFVEDDPILLELYGMMLSDESGTWDAETADSGAAALQRMEKQSFDVIVSDMRMPGMDGVQLIHEVKLRYPRMSRIILSGLSDQKQIAECLGETHQFLAKPFTAKALKATLSRLCGLDAYLQDEQLRALATRLGTLPSFPSLYFDIMKELATDDPSLENIGNLVAADPALTAKMLQVINSAAFGLARKISSPFEAVQYAGTATVRSLALSAHVFSAFEQMELKGFSAARCWDHSIRTALLARTILRQSNIESTEEDDAYTSGMLHDLGKLMLAANMPDHFRQAVSLATERLCPLHEAEQEDFGATHAGVGAYLLGLWGLPVAIVEAVAFHHTPERSESKRFNALAAVYIANALEHEQFGPEPGCPAPQLDAGYLAAIGVQGQLNAWRAEAAKPLELSDE